LQYQISLQQFQFIITSASTMRFTSITFGLTAVLATFVAAAPVGNADVAKRMPTPEEFDALNSVQKREVYRAWYRATNIIGASDDD
jgi:hypothetical protein